MSKKRVPDWLRFVLVGVVASGLVVALYLLGREKLQLAAAIKGFPIASYIAANWLFVTVFAAISGLTLDFTNNASVTKSVIIGLAVGFACASVVAAIAWGHLQNSGYTVSLEAVIGLIVLHIWVSLALVVWKEGWTATLGFAILPLLIGGVPILIFELVRSVLRWTAAKFARVFGLTAAIA